MKIIEIPLEPKIVFPDHSTIVIHLIAANAENYTVRIPRPLPTTKTGFKKMTIILEENED